MTTPTTDAGRALVRAVEGLSTDKYAVLAYVLDIERQAAEKAVTRVLDVLAGEARAIEPYAFRILALIEQHRPKGGPG